jgi:acyl-CoA synthetase (AMP-forming)/AMP-acid ligase II
LNVAALLQRSASFLGARPALAVGEVVVADYAKFSDWVHSLAGALRTELGLNAGDRCGIAMSNTPEIMVIMFACWHANIVAVPMNAKLHRRELQYILDNAGARACFFNDKVQDALGGLDAEVPTLEHLINVNAPRYASLLEHTALPLQDAAPDDSAWLFYTSGTTGRPKGATLTHRNLISMTMNYFCDVDTVNEFDALIHSAPMTHGSGLYGLPHVARGAVQVVPASGGFEPAETLELIARYPGSSFFFAPTMIVRLLESPQLAQADTTNLKTIIYGGGPMYVEDTVRALNVLGPKLVQIYGQGEAPMTITGLSREMHVDTGHPRYLTRLGSVGLARTDVEVRIVDKNGATLDAGQIGEIVLRGDVVMQGYWADSPASESALTGGWLHTGDLGEIDQDGFVTLKDRSKDMIISGGTNIYPREVEEVLLRHRGVLEVSVIGIPHPEWGEDVLAFIVVQPGQEVARADLDALCLEHIARFKRPKHYRFIDSLPKNNYGKVLKTELRETTLREANS